MSGSAFERWRTEFRQGVDDVHGWGQDNNATQPAGGSFFGNVFSGGSAAVGNPVPYANLQTPQAQHDPLFEHLVALCEDQQRELVALREEHAALREEYARAAANRDRYQAGGKKLLAEVKPLRTHCEAIQKIGWRDMSKASHPDTAPSEQRAARGELFKLVKTIFGRN